MVPEPDPHAPLRADVKRLGRILGDTVRDQEGADVFEAVERVRQLAKARRSGDEAASERLQGALEALPDEHAVPVARAFAQFLTLANIAEQHHRVRRRRDYQREPEAAAQRGSLDDAFGRLLAAGVSPQALHEAAVTTTVELVFTAHPTEITRRTMLAKHHQAAALLAELDHTDLTPRQRRHLEDDLGRLVLSIWRTDELRRHRPTPEDEARAGFAVLEKVLWDTLPQFLGDLDEALVAHTGQGLPLGCAPVRFGSWMGGDRDGNPNVTPAVTKRVVLLARWVAADLFRQEVETLRQELSMGKASKALREAAGDGPEPYRAVLRGVHARLQGTLARIEAQLDGDEAPDVEHVATTQDIVRPLRLCYDSLNETGAGRIAEGRLLDTLRRLDAFGLALVRLDLRQDAARHKEPALACAHQTLGDGFDELMDDPLACYKAVLAHDGPVRLDDSGLSAEARDVVETLRTAAALPRDSLGAYVISMARSPADVLAVAVLQRAAGFDEPLPVVPLFETRADLEGAEETMRRLLAEDAYRRLVGRRVTVMIGYSDSAKDAGILAAGWALYQAQERLVAVCREAGVELTIFHGRGGTVGRGGGPAHAAITSLPPGSVAGTLRVTEQGEVIQSRFGLPGIAIRTLELYATAVLEATLTPPPEPKESWRTAMDTMAAASGRAYGDVLAADGFVPYFRAATPLDELGLLKIGSRPARRGGSDDDGVESLRAIPWVFAWTQNRMIIPGWLGVGHGLAAAPSADTVHAMAAGWPFFRATLDMVEMVLAKTEPWIAQQYEEALVPQDLRPLGARLRAAYQETVQAVQEALGRRRLLEENPVLARSIRVRNPYVDPLNLLQIELLRRHRRGEQSVGPGLEITINGVANGMRNTG